MQGTEKVWCLAPRNGQTLAFEERPANRHLSLVVRNKPAWRKAVGGSYSEPANSPAPGRTGDE